MKKIKISIFRNYTIEPILNNLNFLLEKKNLKAEYFISGYDDYLSSFSHFIKEEKKKGTDIFVISLWPEAISDNLNHFFGVLRENEQVKIYKKCTKDIKKLISKIRKFTDSPILLVNSFSNPEKKINFSKSFKKFDNIEISNFFNSEITNIQKSFKSIYNIDTEELMLKYGYQNLLSSQYWFSSMLPFSNSGVLILSKIISKYVFSFQGKNHKLIILDADNTLWGGVLGEDGIHGVKIGKSATGMYFKSFQSTILNLKNKGIVLALCSKNNYLDIKEIFNKNKNMILKLNDFVSIKANWISKNNNIKSILEELNILEDNVIFVDDSIYEINLIKKFFPKMNSLHLSGNPSNYSDKLLDEGNFLSLSFSKTDAIRTKLYKDENQRKELIKIIQDEQKYIKSLRIAVTIEKPNPGDFERLSQLAIKTNQFNSTSKKMTDSYLKEKQKDKNFRIFKIVSKDKIGDLGIVGLILLELKGKKIIIRNFLLSCRILGRKIEDIILLFFFEFLEKNKKKKELEIHLFKNEKNIVIQNFLNNKLLDQNIKIKSKLDNSRIIYTLNKKIMISNIKKKFIYA